jgi:hypothetical protein
MKNWVLSERWRGACCLWLCFCPKVMGKCQVAYIIARARNKRLELGKDNIRLLFAVSEGV